jgi:3-oxoacyl-[acyl-carrier protein] reductase
MELGLAGRRALVTAASKGLGLASARALAEDGARVLICARGAEALAAAEREITEAAAATGRGGKVDTIVADITQPEAPARLVRETVARFGGLDILVANAGGPPAGRALELSDDVILGAVNANLLTTVRLVREAVPHQRSAGWGRICAIASYSVKQPIPTLAASNTARTGLWAWAKTAAADLAGDGITLNLACPGPHLTERLKALGGSSGGGQRAGDPYDFGKVVAFLCSEPAAFVSGVALQVDGATTLGLL